MFLALLRQKDSSSDIERFFAKDNDGDYKLQLAPSLLPCLLRWQLGL